MKNLFSITTIIGLIAILLYLNAKADMVPYSEIYDITIENNIYVLHHHHDWSNGTLTTDIEPFSERNSYSFLELTNKKNRNVVFRTPVPALTYIWISENSKYIVGLSQIKIDNPIQIVIFDVAGNLLYKEHISPEEACLTEDEYRKFLELYPLSKPILDDCYKEIEGLIYIDFMQMGMPNEIGEEAFEELCNYIDNCLPRYSKNFHETVTNFVFWFKEDNPEIQIHEENGILKKISLLDPAGVRFEIPIK